MQIVWRTLPKLALPAAIGLGLAYLATSFVPRPAPFLRPPEELRAQGQAYGEESPVRIILERNVLKLDSSPFFPLGQPPAPIAAPQPASKPAPKPRPETQEQLFARLKKAESAEEAHPIEEKLNAIFRASSSPSVELLMVRTKAAMGMGDPKTALKLAQAVTQIAPGYAETTRLP